MHPLKSLQNIIAVDSKDWSVGRRDAWIYGIVLGWDEPSFIELQRDHKWSDGEVLRLKQLHEKFLELLEQ